MTKVTLTIVQALDRAFSAQKAGQLIEAERLCRQITAAKPDFFDAVHLLAYVQSELGRKEAALTNYDRAIALRPGHAAALSNRGNTLQDLQRFDEALASYDRALSVQPDFAAALSNRGNALRALKRFEEALASYDRALAVRPDFADALSNRGATLYELKRFTEALASYDRALAVRPDAAETLSNRGAALYELKRFAEALASYDRALAVQPAYAEAHFNRGNALQELKRFDEALASYGRALAIRPDYAAAHANQALCRLLIGDFDRGWEGYEWRWQTEPLQSNKPTFAQPLWLGREDISGKTILLHAEQGYGDAIQFCRYVPMVAARGARVILQVPERLSGLMSTLSGAPQVRAAGKIQAGFDVHAPLLSLPLAFGTKLETIPSATPYLFASSKAASDWAKRLGPKRRPRIGLAWSGSPTHKNDHNRSINLGSLLPLFEIDATLVSLQKDTRGEGEKALKGQMGLLDFCDELEDFSDTAALMSNLDLVISVDTSVAHLAGALGKPIWVLLPFVPDWRWLLDREDSPWYPTARLFRQDDKCDWDSVIGRVHSALHDFVQRHS
jgi:tetratricopeptide (TPR) repeat protein